MIALLILVSGVAACAPQRAEPTQSASPVSGGHGAAISSNAVSTSIVVKTSNYGSLLVETSPGTRCQAKAQLPSGGTVLTGDFLSERKADADGRIGWSYGTPVAGAGEGFGHYVLTCVLEGQVVHVEAEFSVP